MQPVPARLQTTWKLNCMKPLADTGAAAVDTSRRERSAVGAGSRAGSSHPQGSWQRLGRALA